MKRLLLVLPFLFSLLFYVPARAEENGEMKLTLQQALDLAVKNNPVVTEANAAVKGSAARLGQSTSAYFPTVSIEGSYARLEPDPFIPFPGFGAIQLFPEDNYDAHVRVGYTLVDFGRRSKSRTAALYNLSSTRYQSALVRENLAFQTIQVYYAIILLQQSISVQQQELKSLNEYLVLAQKRQESGSATSFDVLTTKVKVAGAENQLTDLQNALNKQLIYFRRITGIAPGTPIIFSEELMETPGHFNETELVQQAYNNRLEVKDSRDSLAGASAALAAAKAENYPSLDVGFSYGVKNGYLPDLQEIKTNTVSAARVDIPLFNGLRTYNRVQEQKAVLTAAQARERDTEDSVTAEVRQALSDVNSNEEKIAAAELQVSLATESVAQAKVRYTNGVITNLDLLNVQNSLDEARLLRLRSLYAYAISRKALDKAVGSSLYR